MSKIKLGLLGKDISHSRSPELYQKYLKADFKYDLLDFQESEKIPDLTWFKETYYGINITSPYKEHFLEAIFGNDFELPAINCIKFAGEKIEATNTDFLAIRTLFSKYFEEPTERIALLGNGPMASLFRIYFQERNIGFDHFSRSLGSDPGLIKFKGHESLTIINCCSRSFIFDAGNIELDNSSQVNFWDLNYSFDPHSYLRSISPNFKYIDGFEFLEVQAVEAIKFWNLPLYK